MNLALAIVNTIANLSGLATELLSGKRDAESIKRDLNTAIAELAESIASLDEQLAENDKAADETLHGK